MRVGGLRDNGRTLMTMVETDVTVGERILRVREAGDPLGSPVVYFHGTPGSRLDLAFADDLAADLGVRLVSFDRPGYGSSTSARFGLASVARDTAAVADELGLGRFATFGQSGGGPFALAAGSVLGDRVTRVGVAAGAAPFELVPGALELLDDNDTAALALLPDDEVAAARRFAEGFEPLVRLARETAVAELIDGLQELLSTRDRELMTDERLRLAIGTSLREALRQGATAAGWDNVAWVSQWEVDPSTLRSPALLWYGDDDLLVPPGTAEWLVENIPDARLVLREGEGHLGFMEHTAEMLSALMGESR